GKPLPIDMNGFMGEMQSYFEAFAEELDPDFDVAPVLASIALTENPLRSSPMPSGHIQSRMRTAYSSSDSGRTGALEIYVFQPLRT
ncbi:hypothetical protein, partial [Enterocloster bolteae]|uniref:hypothetical protein n=1 Tax=Enterocloster bolteae TaxID=208479 RepID=UPI001FA88045